MGNRTESGVHFVSLTVGIVVAIVAFIFFLFGGFRTIDAEEVGIKVTFGKVSEEPYYGFNFKWPLVSKFIRFEKTTQRYEGTDATYTKDIQPANIDYVFTYKIVDANAPQLYLSAGTEFETKLITPVLRSVIKDVVGKWGAQELVANRDKASAEIHQKLQEELSAEFFAEISFQMSNVDYSDAFEKGIEAKVLAEQKAQETKNKTLQVEEEAKQKVIVAKGVADAAVTKAQAEAKSLEILAKANAKALDIEGKAISRNPQVLELRKVEAQKQMAASSSNWKTVVFGNGSNTLLLPAAE